MSDQCQRTKNLSLGVNTPRSKSEKGVSSIGGRLRCSNIVPFWGKSLVRGRAPLPPGKEKSGACGAVQAGVAATASALAPSTKIARRDRLRETPPTCGRKTSMRFRASRYDNKNITARKFPFLPGQ